MWGPCGRNGSSSTVWLAAVDHRPCDRPRQVGDNSARVLACQCDSPLECITIRPTATIPHLIQQDRLIGFSIAQSEGRELRREILNRRHQLRPLPTCRGW